MLKFEKSIFKSAGKNILSWKQKIVKACILGEFQRGAKFGGSALKSSNRNCEINSLADKPGADADQKVVIWQWHVICFRLRFFFSFHDFILYWC